MERYKIVNDPVHGTIKLRGVLLELASTPEVNRLNQIHQLGLTYLVFPGAHHTRYEHSLGTSHVAGLISGSLDLDREESVLLECAGLLHDLGHGPFSHSLERIFRDRIGLDHMEVTRDIITGRSSHWDLDWWGDPYGTGLERGETIPEMLESHSIDPDEVAGLVCQDGTEPPENQKTLNTEGEQAHFGEKIYLRQIIHGALDADQLDFLLRDSRSTGVALGIIDLDRIVQTITLFHNELMIHKRGLSALEGMLVARSLMYSSVYFHKTARIAENMLCRAVDSLPDERLKEMWKLSDGQILPILRDEGGLSRDLATRLRYRKLYKSAYRIESESAIGETERAILHRDLIKQLSVKREKMAVEREIERRVGIPEGCVIVDVPDPSFTLSEPRLRRTDLKVLSRKPEPLGRISTLARALQRRPPIPWCLMVSCPEKYRKEVGGVATKLLSVDEKETAPDQ